MAQGMVVGILSATQAEILRRCVQEIEECHAADPGAPWGEIGLMRVQLQLYPLGMRELGMLIIEADDLDRSWQLLSEGKAPAAQWLRETFGSLFHIEFPSILIEREQTDLLFSWTSASQ